jgi:hypothetical protein
MFLMTGTVCDTGLVHACSMQHLLSNDSQLGASMQPAPPRLRMHAQLESAPCLSVHASRTSPLVDCACQACSREGDANAARRRTGPHSLQASWKRMA